MVMPMLSGKIMLTTAAYVKLLTIQTKENAIWKQLYKDVMQIHKHIIAILKSTVKNVKQLINLILLTNNAIWN